MKIIYLIRHCKADGQEREARLTELGESQSIGLAHFLKGKHIDRVVPSPFDRAVATILPFAKEAGMEIETDERLSERVLCAGENPDWLDMLQRSFSDLELAFEGGESGRGSYKTGRGSSKRDSSKNRKECCNGHAWEPYVAHPQIL